MPEIEVNAKVGKNWRKYKDLQHETRGFPKLGDAGLPDGNAVRHTAVGKYLCTK